MKRLLLVAFWVAPAFAEEAHTATDIVRQLREDLKTELDWSDHKLDVKARAAEVDKGDCSKVPFHEKDCATPAGRAHIKRLLDDLLHDRNMALDVERYTAVPTGSSTRLKKRIDKLDKSIVTLESGKTDGVYCDKAHTKIDLVDACLELVPAQK